MEYEAGVRIMSSSHRVARWALPLVACLWSLAAVVGARGMEEFSRAPREEAGWSHAPYEAGECSLCHETDDPENPGPLVAPTNDLCLDCHEQIGEMMTSWSFTHGAAEDDCTNCHNPHNADREMLLYLEAKSLCADCHDEILEMAENSPVQHDAIITDRACLNCHNPHASHVEKLLVQQPFDLCLQCHGEPIQDDQGREMADIKAVVDGAYMLHGPVEEKDCSACHRTHGSENFRLLNHEYPEKFYSPYDRSNYALCFDCHNEEVFLREETTTLTGFRNGSQNLHYVHVNKADRGRTCRACHDVHAAPQEHMIRDAVPYGKSGWMLKVNYTKEENGGSCAKTCHKARSYDRRK